MALRNQSQHQKINSFVWILLWIHFINVSLLLLLIMARSAFIVLLIQRSTINYYYHLSSMTKTCIFKVLYMDIFIKLVGNSSFAKLWTIITFTITDYIIGSHGFFLAAHFTICSLSTIAENFCCTFDCSRCKLFLIYLRSQNVFFLSFKKDG